MSDTEYSQWRQSSGNKAVDDPQQRLLGKLGKLLELKNHAVTEQEAATAASLLSKFLTEHNLSVADLERRGGTAPAVGEKGYDLAKAAFGWKLDLAEGIAEFYYCTSLVDRKKKTVAFVGRPDNVDALTMLYEWVINQIKDIARDERRKHYDSTGEHIDPLRWQVSFGEGAVVRLVERMKEMKARQQEDMSRDQYGDVTALVMHHASEASDYLEEKYGYRQDGKMTKAQREREEKYRLAREKQATLKVQCEASGDMEPYYKLYPWDRPDTPEEIAAQERRNAEYLKKEARNTRRRMNRMGGGRREAATDWDKVDQQDTARAAGRASAGRVNLQPFITGATDKKKVN